MFPSPCNTLSYSSTSSLSSISSFRCALTSSSYHFLHPTRSPLPRPTHNSLPHRPQYSVSQWVSVSRLRVFNMVSCTKGAKYALCALHDNGAGIRCKLQFASCSCSMQATFQLSSLQLQLDSIKATSARSSVSFEAHEKLSVSALKAEPSTDCSAAYSSSNEQGGGRSGRSVLSVAQWRHVSLGQGIKIIANSHTYLPLPRSFHPLGSCV